MKMNGIAKAVVGLVVGFLSSAAPAAVPESYRALWDAANPQIDRNIEQHRKGDATVTVVDASGKPLANAKVELKQVGHEFLFGCNAFVLGQLPTPEQNRRYEEAFAKIFNCATVPFYWGDLEPEPGKPRFEEGSSYIWRRPPTDQIVKWCKARGITPKGHALMYVKTMFMPGWISPTDPANLKALSEKHMARLAERYGRDIPIWDVVNEEIPRLRKPEQWHAVPDDFLAWSFNFADRLFPKTTKLLINDGTEEAHWTTDKYEALVKGLQQRNARVSGIGIQFHAYNRSAMLSGKEYPPQQLAAAYERLGKLGLPLYITEITIPSRDQGAELQGAIVANLYRLWFSTPAMAGVTWWNLGDSTAYKTENKAMGGLLDDQMNPKPAFAALDRLINQEWKTRADAQTNPAGQAPFRGFFGKYQVTVTVGDKTRQFEINHSKAEKQHQLTVR